jgi:hypothetical protein
VRLAGWAALGGAPSGAAHPPPGIISVSTERYDDDGLVLAGASIPFSEIRAGGFSREGPKTLPSFADRDRMPRARSIATLPGVDYDLVAVDADDPVALSAAIERRVEAHRLH